MRYFKLGFFILLAGIDLGCCKQVENEKIEIGALIPLSGDLSDQGSAIIKAMEFAVEDVNNDFSESGKAIRLFSGDSQTNEDVSRGLLSAFVMNDIRVIIGPLSSSVLSGIQDDINESNAIIISPGSTAPDLAIADDNIFRIIPDDKQMAKAIVNKMWEDGKRKLALIFRDDVWGRALSSLIEEEFISKGGEILIKSGFYSPRNSVYQELIDEISSTLSNELPERASQVAIQMTSFQEGFELLDLALQNNSMSAIKWYGSEGICLSDEIFGYPDIVEFARQGGLLAPMYETSSGSEQMELNSRIQEVLGFEPSAFAILAYDALYVAGKTLLEEGTELDVATLRSKLTAAFNGMEGVSGELAVNEAGDRKTGNYSFWRISNSDTIWEKE